MREAHYEAYQKIYGFSREAINDPTQKDDLIREYDRQRNNLKHLIDKTMDAAGVEILIANAFFHSDLKNKPRIKFILIYVASKVGRDAVYFALKSMIDDEIINENTAIITACKILRENAWKLYRLQ